MYIIELEKGVWVAAWSGDPGRTLIKASARKFKTKKQAKTALKKCRTYRPFKNAKIKNLDANIKKTLHLNLKKKWFDMIISGEKKEEYREVKDFWIQRFFKCKTDIEENDLLMSITDLELENKLFSAQINKEIINKYFRKYDTITFSNGYSKTRRQFEIELKFIEIAKGKEKWGANKNEKYFVFHLGAILNSKNCEKPF